jgi:hypothetical protein
MKSLIGMAGAVGVVAMVWLDGLSGNMLALASLAAAACWIVSGWLAE